MYENINKMEYESSTYTLLTDSSVHLKVTEGTFASSWTEQVTSRRAFKFDTAMFGSTTTGLSGPENDIMIIR